MVGKGNQKGITFTETMAVTAIISIILMYILSGYNAFMNVGKQNTEQYSAQIVAQNLLEEHKWELLNESSFNPGLLNSGHLEIERTMFSFSVFLEEIPGLVGEPIYNIVAVVEWNDKEISANTLVTVRD